MATCNLDVTFRLDQKIFTPTLFFCNKIKSPFTHSKVSVCPFLSFQLVFLAH